jgi:hypothetical protein
MVSVSWVRVGLVASALFFGACGGMADPGPGTAGATATGGDTAGGTASVGGPTSLKACKPGFDPASFPERDCAFVGAGLCYAEKLDACACVCPRASQSSVCSSDFPDGPNGHVLVTCS